MILKRLKQEKFWYIKNNWRIKNQILTIQLIIFCFIFGLVIGLIILSQHIVGKYIELSSNFVFIKQTKQQLNNIWIYEENFLKLFHQTQQQLHMVNQLYRFVDNQLVNVPEPISCLNTPNTNDSYCYSSSYCYGLFSNEFSTNDFKEIHTVLSLTSLLTEYRLAIDNTQALYLSHKNEAQFFTINVGGYFSSGFKPHKRPWYVYHLNQTKNSKDMLKMINGNPYHIFKGGIRAASTLNLLNSDNEFIGVIAKNIDFNQYDNFFFRDKEIDFIIINQTGQVVNSKLYENASQEIYSIFDENYSGFNDKDYKQILNFHNQLPFISNCKNIKQQYDLLCRHNSKFRDFSIIQTANISQTPYLLIIFQNSKSLKLSEQAQVNLIKDQFLSITLYYIVASAISICVVIFFSCCASCIIFSQLKLLISTTKLTIYDIYFLTIHLKNLQKRFLIQSSAVTDLYAGVIRLMHHLKPTNKADKCIAEENKQFPCVKRKLSKGILKILEQIQEIRNQNIDMKSLSQKQRRNLFFLHGIK